MGRSVNRGKVVLVLGAGKVGKALHRALRAAGHRSTLRAARRGLPTAPVDAWLLVLAVRDRELHTLVDQIAERRHITARTAVVHVAGALSPEVLAKLRPHCAGVAQMHPMISFASTTSAPSLARGQARVAGDAEAVRRARRVCAAVGLSPRALPGLDTVGYHAAAGLLANGAAALAAVAAELLVASGAPRETAPKMLGPLLRSVAENVEALGFPMALTGPVRRGDAKAVTAHLAALSARLPEAAPLYRALGVAQLPLARAIGEAPASSFDEVEAALTAGSK